MRLARPDKQKVPPGQPSYYIEESLVISIETSVVTKTVDLEPANLARQAHLKRLADRLARVGTHPPPIVPVKRASDPAQSKGVSGIYVRQPIYLDARGKAVQPAPHLRLDMTKSETPVELCKPFSPLDHKKRVMLELDSILGTCFQASTGVRAPP